MPTLKPAIWFIPFVTLSAAQLTKVHGSVPCDINLWVDIFSYDELTVNVRQQADTSYANILSRIRLGIINENDQEELDGRLLHFTPNKNQEYYLKQVVQQLQSLPSTCVCLFPRKQQCAELNAGMLALVAGPEIILKSNDEFESRNIVQRKKAIEYLKTLAENSNNTAALEDTVAIKIGCKVMLRRNISSTLVNGSIGTVQEIIKDAMDDSVSKIKIQFGDEEHLLERLKVKFQVFKNLYVVRSQFPITLAYAITIHKSQSLSLECCMMDIGNFVFCEGQTYVALSRLTTLNGVYLVNYDPKKVLVNHAAIEEYNRLRSKYRPDLKQIEISVNNSSSRSDILWWKKGHIGLDPVDDIERGKGKDKGRGGKLPGFQNSHNNCFANSTLQCLLSLTSINNNIMLSPDSPLKRIAVAYNNPFKAVLNSDEIVSYLGFPLDEMQDVTEFIGVLIRAFPHIINEIQFLTEDIRTCTRCSHSYTFKYERHNRENHLDEMYKISLPNQAETSALLQQTARSNKTKSLTMIDLLRFAYAPKHLDGAPCPVCQVSNVSTQSLTIKEAGNIVILALNIFKHLGNKGTRVQRQKITVSGAPATILDIAGSRYQLKASIFHHGINQEQAHYTSYIRFEEGWNLANDTNITAPGWPKLSQKMYVLFYEKITS